MVLLESEQVLLPPPPPNSPCPATGPDPDPSANGGGGGAERRPSFRAELVGVVGRAEGVDRWPLRRPSALTVSRERERAREFTDRAIWGPRCHRDPSLTSSQNLIRKAKKKASGKGPADARLWSGSAATPLPFDPCTLVALSFSAWKAHSLYFGCVF